MGLQPLEFADCLTDSPLFRTKLHEHERELDRTSKSIKTLIQHGKHVFEAAKQLSKAQRLFARDLKEFNFECIDQQTDDEITIAQSLAEFGKYLSDIEDLREKMIEVSEEQFVKRLENFRKENLGAAKEEKKNFEKQTAKFCQSQERYLNMKTKLIDSQLKEADAQVEMEKRGFYQASMKYVLKLQEVQEKKKFEFVEILLGYMLGWLSFYHEGYECLEEFKQYDFYLRLLLQKTRESFETTREQAERLMSKMLEARGSSTVYLKPMDQSATMKGFTREGYLYLLEKKALGTTWTKYYCQYKKDTKEFYLILYNQIGGKVSEPEQFTLESCVRRAAESIERRFCFDITVKEKQTTMTFQALSEDDRRLWLDAMDGKEPIYLPPKAKTEDTLLDDVGFNFMRKSIAAIETRGLQEQGLYRVVGVNSKVVNLLKCALDPKKTDKVNYDDPNAWETKTITSAIKNYLRSLPEPLMTFKLHEQFIKAAKQESKTLRVLDVHKYVHQLPKANFEMLDLLIAHLQRVAEKNEENKMTVANLGVCFGPTLMRPEEESVAAIMDIKFCNIVVEILINNYDKIFKTPPDEADMVDAKESSVANQIVDSSSNGRPRALSNHTVQPQILRANMTSSALGGDYSHHQASQSWQQPSRIYANQAPVHPSRSKPRPIQVYNPNTGGFETLGSVSSSSESLNSASSSKTGFSPRTVPSTPSSISSGGGAAAGTPDRQRRQSHDNPTYAVGGYEINVVSSVPIEDIRFDVIKPANRFNLNFVGSDAPAFGSVKKRSSNDYSMGSSMHSSLTGSHASLSSSSGKTSRRTVVTRYPCKAGHESELSFEANQMIYNVRPSREPGWLEGELDGKVGLVPANYVEYIDS